MRAGSLGERLQREGQLRIADALGIARDVAGALEHAHAHGIIHRDIKPENILLDEGSAFIADFGVARIIDAADRKHLTQTGMAIGTPYYMSPEQADAGAAIRRAERGGVLRIVTSLSPSGPRRDYRRDFWGQVVPHEPESLVVTA